MKSNNFS